MCRFVAYLGSDKALIADLIEKPSNSLINQSKHFEGEKATLNADGFGIAWYNHELDNTPGVFKSTQPAWNDLNLKHLSEKIKSDCFLGHIRASTIGGVGKSNCHPFSYDEYAFVHNGTIREFTNIKRELLNLLESELFFKILGTTDSECLFFLIMQYIRHEDLSLEKATLKAIDWIVTQQASRGHDNFSRINIALTDGHSIIATRFASKEKNNLSLFYALTDNSIIISSEKLDKTCDSWVEVPDNHYLLCSRDNLQPKVKPIK